ncbi:MAG: serine/threonine protein kinase, partial [Anaerolineae bacterium]|nr:serine/threonine protein kinase [Anaerolineae bacterium]
MGFENLTGQSLGQYELRELLGVGGMGAVYRAYQATLQREVAVKVLPLSLASEPGYVERFIREARTAGALEHPHIVRIYDYGTQGDITYLVMALLRGGSLSQRIQQREEKGVTRPSLGEVAQMLSQIASALDYAHHEGVLHRDIKPANIMFDNQGRAYLSDFGIAKLMGANTALTGTGVAMGSPSYMPPEQWMGRELTPSADQYAMGVTVYQTVAGRLPFEADSAAQLMYKHFNEDPTPLNITRTDLPAAVSIVLTRAMAKDPDKRFPNMTMFAQAFESAVEGNKGDATNFFVYKLRAEKPRLPGAPTPMPAQPSNGSAPARTPAPKAGQVGEGTFVMPPIAQPRNRTPLIAGVAIVLVIVIIGLIIALISGDDEDELAETATAVAGIANETSTAIARNLEQTGTAIAENAHQTATAIANTAEARVNQTVTAAAIAFADSLTQTAAALPTQTFTPTPTETLTATPTPDPTETHTATPTSTHTDTPTIAPTATETATPSATATTAPTQTNTPRPTLTISPSATATGMTDDDLSEFNDL